LGAENRKQATPLDVRALLHTSPEELDELFRVSPPGPTPNGECDGTAIAFGGTEFAAVAAKVWHLLAWRGKVFDAERGVVVNRVTPLDLHAVRAKVYRADSWVDQKECIVLDYSETSLVAHYVRDEIRLIGPGFYLGKVYWAKDRLIDFCLQF
jgi:hypothetical protein